jgi:hypothetical protein
MTGCLSKMPKKHYGRQSENDQDRLGIYLIALNGRVCRVFRVLALHDGSDGILFLKSKYRLLYKYKALN